MTMRTTYYDRWWNRHLKAIEERTGIDPTEEGQNRGATVIALCVAFGLHSAACGHWDRVEAPDARLWSYRARNHKAEADNR